MLEERLDPRSLATLPEGLETIAHLVGVTHAVGR
jgi:hypothetical protein